jgi:hypothetical protein
VFGLLVNGRIMSGDTNSSSGENMSGKNIPRDGVVELTLGVSGTQFIKEVNVLGSAFVSALVGACGVSGDRIFCFLYCCVLNSRLRIRLTVELDEKVTGVC